MNICVVLKQTFDTEEKIKIEAGRVSEDGVKFIINPYDEYAVEEAIRQKEQHGGSITVVSVGPERTTEALRTALAMGADEAVLISDEGLALDEYSVSKLLSAYVGKQSFDLVLGGNFSIDNGAGQVAVRLAHLIGYPHVSSITELKIEKGSASVSRDAEGDIETVQVSLPAVFTAQQGLNEPRYPSLPGIMKAKKKPLQQISPSELGLAAEDLAPRTAQTGLWLPAARKAGRLISGSPAEQASSLVQLLRTEAKIV